MLAAGRSSWIAWRAACLCVLTLISAAKGENSPATFKAPLGVVRIVQPRYPVAIPKLDQHFDVGDRATLVQENEAWFIICTETKDGGAKLAAVPRRKGNVKVAWVTPEDTVFFGYRVASVDGVLYLTMGEELPVLSESDGAYEVLIKRGARSASLLLPKNDSALYFIPNPVYGQIPEDLQVTGTLPSSAVAESLLRDRTADISTRSKGMKKAAAAKIRVPPPDTNWDLFVVSYLLPDEWAIATSVVAEDGKDIGRIRFESPSMQRLTWSSVAVIARWIVVGVVSFILLVGVGVAALGKARLEKRVPAPPQPNTAEAVQEEPVPINTPPVPDFSGSLSSMSLGSVIQFLNSDKETGTLTVLSNEHQPVGTVDFLSGEIVNARTNGEEGVPAVHRLLANAEGHFAFVRSKNPNFQRKIAEPTMSLLLEAHRLRDESTEVASEPPEAKPSRKKDSLRLRRRASH